LNKALVLRNVGPSMHTKEMMDGGMNEGTAGTSAENQSVYFL